MAREPSEKQKHRIWETAETLVAKGIENPTNDDVLQEMGGGSIADISPAMREWRKKRKEASQLMFTMPDSIKNAGLQVVAQMWAAVDNEARQRVEDAEAKAEEKTAEIESELQDSLHSIKNLESSLEQVTSERDDLKSELQGANKEIKALEKKAHQLELDKEKTQTRLESAKENEGLLRKQIEELQKELLSLAKQNTTKARSSKTKD
jgi:chromosome segregation ATPase